MFVAIITHPSGNGLSNMSKDDVAIYGPFDSRNEAYLIAPLAARSSVCLCQHNAV